MNYPLKLSIKSEIVPIAAVVAAWILAIYFYAHFPEVVVSHWNFRGVPDSYSGKASGAFAIPGLLTAMYAMFLALPLIDPKKERYGEFVQTYHFFKTAIMLVLFVIYTAAGLYNLGYPIKISVVVPWLVGLLMIALGNYMGKIKSNWFMGVRTPWTLSSENVWNKTNRFGGFMMVLFGAIIIICPYLPQVLGLVVFILGALLATAGTFLYSFLLYKKERAAAERLIIK